MEVDEHRIKRSGARPRASAAPRRRPRRASAPIMQVAVVAIALLAFAGVARVAVAVRAAEAAIDAHRLERSIRAEMLQARELEADCSALEAPSRIGALASSALNMRTTTAPKYICLPSASGKADAVPVGAARETGGTSAKRGLAALVEEIVASEAQALLVGDVGLASSR
jgi:hypothetical protein